MTVTLRPATMGDLDAIVGVFLECWRQSYADVLPQSVIDAMTDDRATRLWDELLGAGRGSLLVAVEGPTVLGVTRFEASNGEGIVHSLYVTPRAQGRGVGRVLLKRAAADMELGGPRQLSLWVFAENHASLAFYRRLGWTPDGASRTQDEFGAPELRLTLQEVTS